HRPVRAGGERALAHPRPQRASAPGRPRARPPRPRRRRLRLLPLAGPMSRWKAVFLDAGGTLIDPDPSVGEIYARTAERHGARLETRQINANYQLAWKQRRGLSKHLTGAF